MHEIDFSRRLGAWSAVVPGSEPAAWGYPGKQLLVGSKKGCKPKRKKAVLECFDRIITPLELVDRRSPGKEENKTSVKVGNHQTYSSG